MKKQASKKSDVHSVMLCDKMDFVMHEEYRLLRTNIKYSLTDDKEYHVIGVTSAVKGEAKTTTAINLAYTLAENGEKVCLIEGDMRLPTFRKKMNIESHAGLSEFLTGQKSIDDVVEMVKYQKCDFACIQAGTLPPNPSELLSSPRIDKVFETLGKTFTYIIVDLPPVTMVSDAVVVGGKIDGVIMVVSQPICTKRLLKEAMRQLTITHIKVIGFVRTLTTEHGFGYSRYGRKRHGYQYAKYEYSIPPENKNIE